MKVKKSLKVRVNDFDSGLNITRGENITDLDTSVDCYNFNFNKGVLLQGMGVKSLLIPTSKTSDEEQILPDYYDNQENIRTISIFRDFNEPNNEYRDKLVFYCDDKALYYCNVNCLYPVVIKIPNTEFSSRPKTFQTKYKGKDIMIASNGVGKVMWWPGDSVPLAIENIPQFVDMCEYKGFLYCIMSGDQNTIRYTTNTNLDSWSEELNSLFDEGEIVITDGLGKLNKLVNFQGHLYAFRDYSILKITQYEDAKKPLISTMYVSGNRIYPNTIQICGDEMIMLTTGGLIKFDGVVGKEIELSFDNMLTSVDNQKAVATYHQGKYFLACKMNYFDNEVVGAESGENCVNNSLICYDSKNGKYQIVRGLDISDIASIKSDIFNKLIICFYNGHTNVLAELTNDGKFFDENSPKYWCSPLTDLGYSNCKKVIKQVSLFSKYDCKLTIFTESEQKSYNISGSEIISKYPVRLCGKQIGFKIESNSTNAYISNLCLDIDLIDSGFSVW